MGNRKGSLRKSKPGLGKTSAGQPLDRRARIIAAALECFGEKGVPGTRMAEVAKRARIDPPLIHYYFPDLETLHVAVIEKALEGLREYSLRGAKNHPDHPRLEMKEYIAAPLTWVRDFPAHMTLWLYFYYRATHMGPFRKMNDAIRKVGRERIRLMIYRGIENGDFRLASGVSAEEAAAEIQAILTGIAVVFATESDFGFERALRMNEARIFAILGVAS